MRDLKFEPREIFNKLNMGERLIYYDMENQRRIDIFLDIFNMCHRFDFRESILRGTKTLRITELVMTKLQVVEITDKEYNDLLLAFHDFDIGYNGVDGVKISKDCARDWGLHTTFTKNLDRLKDRASEPALSRIIKLRKMIDDYPKSLGWRLRARIGEKARWYQEVDSDHDEALVGQ